MKTNLSTLLQVAGLCFALLIAPAIHAQTTPSSLPPVPNDETRLIDAGALIEKDGKLRKTSILLILGGGLLGGLIFAAADGDSEMVAPGAILMGGCAVVGIGLNLSAAGKARKAGLLLQGK